MTDKQLETLNKAYLMGEYDLKRYRELREEHINAITGYVPGSSKQDARSTQNSTLKHDVVNEPTLQLNEAKPPAAASNISDVQTEKSHRGPSFLQFLWVSIAILLFIYMYTATID